MNWDHQIDPPVSDFDTTEPEAPLYECHGCGESLPDDLMATSESCLRCAVAAEREDRRVA